jgi:hypothetical protein
MDVFGEVPTAETISVAKPERKERSTDDFFVEPAPRVSVVRHH